MIDFIARYFSSLWALLTAPFRAIWHGITRLFPARDCTIMDTSDGDVLTYQQSSFWRFTKFCAFITMTLWASWSTYIYMYHRPLLQQRTQQLEQVRNQHNRQMSDLKIYLQKYTELTKSLNLTDDKILKADKTENTEKNIVKKGTKTEKNAKNSKTATKNKSNDKEKEELLNAKSKIIGELDFLHTRIVEMMEDENYTPEFEKVSELSAEFELVRNENNNLKQRGIQTIDEVKEIAEADQLIVETISKMTSENISELRTQLKRINTSITKLGLNEPKLIEQANKYSSQFIGAPFTQIKLSKNADAKYKKLAQDIEEWHGMKRLVTILPLGAPVNNTTITSQYGIRNDPFTGKKKQHKGIDFAGKIGTELYAVAPGRVVSSGERSGYGTTVEIDHGLGFTTLYAHLSKTMVARGDWVRPGSVVGLGGSSGRSTGPHLHYEIRYKGTPFNPTKFIKE
ncbi:MAG: peptidoglycan DD-metalloendopeptidase family protein [Alphaproteobacteria bacterium]|nr:peptidoglycan DD-metalloendopeptidase family protein [Alphaproteobacteria bacterium]